MTRDKAFKLIEKLEKIPTSITITKLWGGPWMASLDGGPGMNKRRGLEVRGDTFEDAVETAGAAAERYWGVQVL